MGEDEVEQIDGIVYAEGLACLVESKDQIKAVNFEPIAKLRNQLFSGKTSARRSSAPELHSAWVGDVQIEAEKIPEIEQSGLQDIVA